MRSHFSLLSVLVLCTPFAFGETTETVTLSAAKDNTLYESTTGDQSNGSGAHMFVGRTARDELRRALVAFDVRGAVPPRSKITGVALQLFMSRTRTTTTPVTVHRVLDGWGEGASNAGGQEGRGAASASGDATWIHRFFPDVMWEAAGGDFVSTASATSNVGGNGFYTWENAGRLAEDVEAWLADSTSNHGWIIIGTESAGRTAKRFETRETFLETARPQLTIAFEPPFSFREMSISTASAAFVTAGADEFSFAATFAIAPESDGIDPANEEVVVRFGGFEESIPAGGLDCFLDRCRYESEGPRITDLILIEGVVAARATGVDLGGTKNPVTVLLAIGNDEGTATSRLEGLLRFGEPRRGSRSNL